MTLRAFTLIELLVAIAIVSILAAILFPVFAQAREKSRQSACISNEKQLALAVKMYTDDNDGYVPAGAPYAPLSHLSGLGWGAIIYPYIKTVSVFHCPDDPTSEAVKSGKVIGYPVSYCMNSNDVGIPDGGYSSQPQTVLFSEVRGNQSKINDTSEGTHNLTVAAPSLLPKPAFQLSPTGNGAGDTFFAITAIKKGVVTTVRMYTQYDIGDAGGRFTKLSVPVYYTGMNGRHSTGANYVAVDGHVKWIVPARVSTGPNAPLPQCHQGNSPAIAGCSGHGSIAAGTADTRYVMTFSAL